MTLSIKLYAMFVYDDQQCCLSPIVLLCNNIGHSIFSLILSYNFSIAYHKRQNIIMNASYDTSYRILCSVFLFSLKMYYFLSCMCYIACIPFSFHLKWILYVEICRNGLFVDTKKKKYSMSYS